MEGTVFGKTAIAAWIIAERKLTPLALVNRRQLLDQWQEGLALFLGLQPNDIGQIRGGKNKATGSRDVGILQSLSRKGRVNDIVKGYGQVIVDECRPTSYVGSYNIIFRHLSLLSDGSGSLLEFHRLHEKPKGPCAFKKFRKD